MSNKLKLFFGYEGTDFTRQYTLNGIADSLLSGCKTKIKAINASVAGGTDGGLVDFFRSDDYDATESIGAFTGIKAAQLETQSVTIINIDDEEEEGD